MRAAVLIRSLLLAGLSLGPAAPTLQAAESRSAAMAPAEDPAQDDAAPAASPWEHPLWHNATTLMRLYVCDHARRPPSWCATPVQAPAPTALPEMQGPVRDPEDAKWQAFLETAVPADLTDAELAMVRRRAVERRDPQAMEILGFLYAEGLSVERDYVEAYRWYGMAFLAGEAGVRANMDIVWQQLQRHDLRGAAALKREFDALAAGEVPASLTPLADSIPQASADSAGKPPPPAPAKP